MNVNIAWTEQDDQNVVLMTGDSSEIPDVEPEADPDIPLGITAEDPAVEASDEEDEEDEDEDDEDWDEDEEIDEVDEPVIGDPESDDPPVKD